MDDFTQRGLLPLGDDRAQIVQTLGHPDSIDSRMVPNRHVPGVQDTLYTLHYPGLAIHLHHPGGGRDLLSEIVVSSNRYLRYASLGIGVPEDQVRRVLGPPDEERGQALTYRCRSCRGAGGSVEIFLGSGRIDYIRFNYYVD